MWLLTEECHHKHFCTNFLFTLFHLGSNLTQNSYSFRLLTLCRGGSRIFFRRGCTRSNRIKFRLREKVIVFKSKGSCISSFDTVTGTVWCPRKPWISRKTWKTCKCFIFYDTSKDSCCQCIWKRVTSHNVWERGVGLGCVVILNTVCHDVLFLFSSRVPLDQTGRGAPLDQLEQRYDLCLTVQFAHHWLTYVFIRICTNSSLSEFGYSTQKLTITFLAPTPAVAFFSKPWFYYSDPCINDSKPLILAKTLARSTLIFETFYVFRETEVLTVSVEWWVTRDLG